MTVVWQTSDIYENSSDARSLRLFHRPAVVLPLRTCNLRLAMFKVLLVDDDQDMLELLSFHLKRAGFCVLTAETAMEGLNQARRSLPEIIILDLLLPDLDGITVCEILRKQPSTADIPVLMLTAVGGQMARLAGLESGAVEYLVKPVRPQALVRRILALLTRKPLDLATDPEVQS